MSDRDFDVSGAIVFWTLQPTLFESVVQVFDQAGYPTCVPNPRTDQSALENSIKSVYGTKDKTVVSRKKPKRNGVELVNIERAEYRNSYVTNFGAKVVDGQVKADFGYADEDRLTEEFLKHKAVLTSGALGQALSNAIGKMDGMKGFDRAGVYYVPEHYLPAWKRLAALIESCGEGNRITTVRAAIDESAARAIRDVLVREVQEKATQLLDDVAKGTLNDDQLHARVEAAQALVDRVEIYSNIIGESMENLKNVALVAKSAAAAAAMQDFAGAGVSV